MTFPIVERRFADYQEELNKLIDEMRQMAPHYKINNWDGQLSRGRINQSTTLTIYNPRVDWRIYGEEEAVLEALASGFDRKDHYSVEFSIDKGACYVIEPLKFVIPHDTPWAQQETLLKSALEEGIQYIRQHSAFMIDSLSEDKFIKPTPGLES